MVGSTESYLWEDLLIDASNKIYSTFFEDQKSTKQKVVFYGCCGVWGQERTLKLKGHDDSTKTDWTSLKSLQINSEVDVLQFIKSKGQGLFPKTHSGLCTRHVPLVLRLEELVSSDDQLLGKRRSEETSQQAKERYDVVMNIHPPASQQSTHKVEAKPHILHKHKSTNQTQPQKDETADFGSWPEPLSSSRSESLDSFTTEEDCRISCNDERQRHPLKHQSSA